MLCTMNMSLNFKSIFFDLYLVEVNNVLHIHLFMEFYASNSLENSGQPRLGIDCGRYAKW